MEQLEAFIPTQLYVIDGVLGQSSVSACMNMYVCLGRLSC